MKKITFQARSSSITNCSGTYEINLQLVHFFKEEETVHSRELIPINEIWNRVWEKVSKQGVTLGGYDLEDEVLALAKRDLKKEKEKVEALQSEISRLKNTLDEKEGEINRLRGLEEQLNQLSLLSAHIMV